MPAVAMIRPRVPHSNDHAEGAHRCETCDYGVSPFHSGDYACPRCGALLADLYHRERNPPLHPGTLTVDQIRAEYAAVGMTMPTRRAGRMAA